jgi:hypothetical protein
VEAVRLMHFHERVICIRCNTIHVFSTPIPHTVFWLEPCPRCFVGRVIGERAGTVCDECADILVQQAVEEETRPGEPA